MEFREIFHKVGGFIPGNMSPGSQRLGVCVGIVELVRESTGWGWSNPCHHGITHRRRRPERGLFCHRIR
jgi:hypothetical protein